MKQGDGSTGAIGGAREYHSKNTVRCPETYLIDKSVSQPPPPEAHTSLPPTTSGSDPVPVNVAVKQDHLADALAGDQNKHRTTPFGTEILVITFRLNGRSGSLRTQTDLEDIMSCDIS
jgi:hypothetical protein